MVPVKRHLKAALGAGAFLVFTVFAVGPSDIAHNADGWLETLGGWTTLVAALVGAAAASLAWLTFRPTPDDGVRLLDKQAYASEFRRRMQTGTFNVVKVFGYTGETVLQDLLLYEDRYNGALAVRLLHRNWIAEQRDEEAHNARSDTSDTKLWNKSASIRAIATDPWDHAMQREIRYYDGPPTIKGVILADDHGIAHEAFVSFFQWEPLPTKGGSPFKGIPEGVVYLDGSTPSSAAVVRYLDSQFERAWSTSRTPAQLLAEERAPA